MLKTVCEYAIFIKITFEHGYAYKNNTNILAIPSPRGIQNVYSGCN